MPPPLLRGSIGQRCSEPPLRQGLVISQGPLSTHHRRSFTASPPFNARRKGITRQRHLMWAWLKGPGMVFREPREGSTNYLNAYDKSGRLIREVQAGAERSTAPNDGGETTKPADGPAETLEDLQPFPLNPYFRSQSVLSVPLRDEIHRRVVQDGQTVRQVSQALNVSMERVGAVVRLKTVEDEWVRDDKPLAKPYQRSVLGMLPQTLYSPQITPRHESINDLPVHRATLPQLFHPTSESRHFTRADAGRVFSRTLLPADARIPHPDMIATEAERTEGLSTSERDERRRDRWDAEMTARDEARTRREEQRARRELVVEGQRWDFKITKIRADEVGHDERSPKGVGWRYGVPLDDRKKGKVRIPTSVE